MELSEQQQQPIINRSSATAAAGVIKDRSCRLVEHHFKYYDMPRL